MDSQAGGHNRQLSSIVTRVGATRGLELVGMSNAAHSLVWIKGKSILGLGDLYFLGDKPLLSCREKLVFIDPLAAEAR